MRLPYTKLAPTTYAAMLNVGHTLSTNTALEFKLMELVKLRASIVNGCGFCKGMHIADMKKHNLPDTLIEAVADYENSDAFTPREKAAMRWTDVLTNIQDSHAADAEYAAVNEFFKDKDLVDLTFAIAQINAWNRLGIAFAVEWDPPKPKTAEVHSS